MPDERAGTCTINKEKIFKQAKERFDVTDDLQNAGWLLPDGSLLDFHRRNDMEYRGLDHSTIRRAFDDGDCNPYGAFDTFMSICGIRVTPYSWSDKADFEASCVPTEEQFRVINRARRESGGGELELIKPVHGEGYSLRKFINGSPKILTKEEVEIAWNELIEKTLQEINKERDEARIRQLDSLKKDTEARIVHEHA